MLRLDFSKRYLLIIIITNNWEISKSVSNSRRTSAVKLAAQGRRQVIEHLKEKKVIAGH